MSESPGKRGPRKALRVATAFTGVTACAAAFAPAAGAQTGRPLAPTNTVSDPHCHNGHWFHAEKLNFNFICYGDRGSRPIFSTFVAFCGGNNFGRFSGVTRSGNGHFLGNQTFGPGITYYEFIPSAHYSNAPFEMSTLHISKFSGTDSCFVGGG